MKTHQVIIAISAGLVSLCAGTLLSSNHKDLGKSITLASLLSVPTVAGSYWVIDRKAKRRIGEAQDKVREADTRTKHFERQAQDSLTAMTLTQSKLAEIERKNIQLVTDLATLTQTLEATQADRARLAEMVATLQPTIVKLEKDLAASKEQLEQLQIELEAWEAEFSNRVESEAKARFKEARNSEIEEIFQTHDQITEEAMRLFRQLQQWGEKVASGHESKRQIITSLASSYNANLDELDTAINTEREQYITQIEVLHEKIGRLQAAINGDLTEPQYLEVGFSPEGRIANALANWLWVHRQIPLKVTGFEIGTDGTVTAGYSYSRSLPVEALVKVIEDDSPTITRNLGLYAIEKPQKLQITDCLSVKVRRSRPARKADKGSLYRSKEEFIKYILSQPVRLRLVGEPGSGKTPTVAVLVAHILSRGFLSANTPNGQKLPYCVVESCNPLAGISVKNGDELDFCLRWNDGKKGFKGLVEEYRFRKNPANANYKNQVGYIWIADELDNSMAEMSKDEAKPFKDALKDGGHVNLGVIVMGQSANVSTSKGLSIDDQKMMTNIYIDPVSIRTFLTQYGERFYSKKAVERALATLEELELELEEQNEIICDTAREFRIAMVTANRSPVFYQLPYFDSAEIDVDSYLQTLEIVNRIRMGRHETSPSNLVETSYSNSVAANPLECLDTSRHSPMSGLATRRDMSVKPPCPHCGSNDIRSKGDKWACKNPEHSTLAPGKPKEWKK